MSSSRGDSSRRISNACLSCQKRKAKCDGGHPTCSSCARRGFICEYAVRKTRGPGKSKEYIQMLEERVQKLQSSAGPGQTSQESETQSDVITAGNPGLSSSSTAQTITPAPILELPEPDIKVSEIEGRNSTPAQKIALLMKGLSFLSKVDVLHDNVKKLMSRINPGRFPNTTFTPLLPRINEPGLVVHVIDNINGIYPSVTQKSLAEIFNQQYDVGEENSTDNPGRWALLNSYMAMLLQWKVVNPQRQNFAALEWAYLKNAYSVFSDVIIRGKDLMSCQGLLFLTMAMQGNADAWTSHHVLSAAAHLAHALGLHRKPAGKLVTTIESEQGLRTFWLIYILDSTEVMKSGKPPCISHSDVSSDLPDERPTYELGCVSLSEANSPFNIFRCRAELAIMESKIHRVLFSGVALDSKPAERFLSAESLHVELETWIYSLPSEIRPFFENPSIEDLEPPIVMLHFTYYSCIGKLAVANRRLRTDNPAINIPSKHSYSGQKATFPELQIAAARATIHLLRYVDTQSFTCLWRIICYPIAASISIVASVLNDPQNYTVTSGATLIQSFVLLLRKFHKVELCDVGRMLDGCTRLHDIVLATVGAQHVPFPSPETNNPGSGRQLTQSQLESLKSQLSTHDDHLLLAQGLVGNIPGLTKTAASVFADVFADIQELGDGYGLFVPDHLKPETHNFRFA